MDSNCLLQSLEQLSDTESLYSNKGRTYAVYNFPRASLLVLNLSARIICNLFQAVSVILFICSDKVHELGKVMPRCLWVEASFNVILFISRGG